MEDFYGQLENWSGEGVVVRHDSLTGSRFLIALHDSTFGPAAGGTRMKSYPTPDDALCDVLRLAEGMTYKWTALGLEYGGGKAVIDIPSGLDDNARRGLLERYGELLQTLRGSYITGADLGTSADDMALIATRTHHVLGVDHRSGRGFDPGQYTAHGVHQGIRAALESVFGSPDPAGRTILVQGLGGVGGPLARALAAAGARLLLSDLDSQRAEKFAAEVGGTAVAGDAVYGCECDLYAPCAIGATLNPDSIPRLRCRIVAGAANNQLLTDADAKRLAQRDILYVTDYVINGGGAQAIALMHQGIYDRQELMTRIATIGDTVARILSEASETHTDPLAVTRRQVKRKLAERRAETAGVVVEV